MPLLKDLISIPERVHQGDFVLKLTEGLSHPEETAAQYVATPALVDAFDRALGLIGDALSSGHSKATYLHGSFGSGKSHFMAVLSLLLSGHEAAWRIPELHGLREKYAYAGKQRLLELHFHMIGAETLSRSCSQRTWSTFDSITLRPSSPASSLTRSCSRTHARPCREWGPSASSPRWGARRRGGASTARAGQRTGSMRTPRPPIHANRPSCSRHS